MESKVELCRSRKDNGRSGNPPTGSRRKLRSSLQTTWTCAIRHGFKSLKGLNHGELFTGSTRLRFSWLLWLWWSLPSCLRVRLAGFISASDRCTADRSSASANPNASPEIHWANVLMSNRWRADHVWNGLKEMDSKQVRRLGTIAWLSIQHQMELANRCQMRKSIDSTIPFPGDLGRQEWSEFNTSDIPWLCSSRAKKMWTRWSSLLGRECAQKRIEQLPGVFSSRLSMGRKSESSTWTDEQALAALGMTQAAGGYFGIHPELGAFPGISVKEDSFATTFDWLLDVDSPSESNTSVRRLLPVRSFPLVVG